MIFPIPQMVFLVLFLRHGGESSRLPYCPRWIECYASKSDFLAAIHYFVGNKTKGLILKRVFQENKAHQIFPKTNISYVWYVRVRIKG